MINTRTFTKKLMEWWSNFCFFCCKKGEIMKSWSNLFVAFLNVIVVLLQINKFKRWTRNDGISLEVWWIFFFREMPNCNLNKIFHCNLLVSCRTEQNRTERRATDTYDRRATDSPKCASHWSRQWSELCRPSRQSLCFFESLRLMF